MLQEEEKQLKNKCSRIDNQGKQKVMLTVRKNNS